MAIWNKDIETMPREKLEELQLKDFRKQSIVYMKKC